MLPWESDGQPALGIAILEGICLNQFLAILSDNGVTGNQQVEFLWIAWELKLRVCR